MEISIVNPLDAAYIIVSLANLVPLFRESLESVTRGLGKL